MNPQSDVIKLTDYIRTVLDLKSAKFGKEDSYASLPLCVIDAVFSIGVHYDRHTKPTVLRWCKFTNWQPYDFSVNNVHTINDLISSIKPYEERGDGFKTLATDVFKNSQRTSSRSGILKAEAVYRFAVVLSRFGIQTLDDTKNGIKNDSEVELEIKKIPGQKSGISYKYFCMLAGSENLVKADRMLCRFASNAVGRVLMSDETERLVINACKRLNENGFPEMNPRFLDNTIWNYQRSH